MADYSDEELLELSRQEATEELSDEQFRRYNSLKAQKLEEDVEEYKGEQAESNAEGLDEILSSAQDDLTETIQVLGNDLEVLVDPDESDVKKINELRGMAEEEDLSDEEIQELKDSLFEFMGQFTVNYDAEDWKQTYSDRDVGLRTIVEVAFEMFNEVERVVQQKKRR